MASAIRMKRPEKLSEAAFEVIEVTPERVVIMDLMTGASVTNDAERVIDDLLYQYGNVPERRYFYRDTQGVFDELLIESGGFSGFRSCTPNMRAELAQLVEERSVE